MFGHIGGWCAVWGFNMYVTLSPALTTAVNTKPFNVLCKKPNKCILLYCCDVCAIFENVCVFVILKSFEAQIYQHK